MLPQRGEEGILNGTSQSFVTAHVQEGALIQNQVDKLWALLCEPVLNESWFSRVKGVTPEDGQIGDSFYFFSVQLIGESIATVEQQIGPRADF